MTRFALITALALAAPLVVAQSPTVPPGHAVATFAGGCFWCMAVSYTHLTLPTILRV